MIADALRVLVLLGSGVVAGVLFAVALAVLPALTAMPADRYVYTHQLIGPRWDPTMPILVLAGTAADIALAFLAPESRSWYVAAAVLSALVSVVSHFANVPINRRVRTLDPDDLPADWRDPRPRWRRWHTARTVLALAALFMNAVAAVR